MGDFLLASYTDFLEYAWYVTGMGPIYLCMCACTYECRWFTFTS